jgi:endonuclease/exonuclease/phosphatase family metal-dependent hydrolase
MKPLYLKRVRIVVQNLWGLRGDWQSRRAVLAAGLGELAPDLVAFVEAIKTDEYDQAADLLGPDYYFFHAATRHENGDGAVIATRWPLGERHEVELHLTPRTADFACTALVAEVLVPEPYAPLLFVNHMPNWQLQFERERELQAVAAARFIEELADGFDTHVVVAGDLTADPDAASVRFLTGRQSLEGISVCYRDAWESIHPGERGETYTRANALLPDWDWPSKRLDYVFVRCGLHGGPTLEITACETIFDKPVDGTWASDHFGVVADLELPQPRAFT